MTYDADTLNAALSALAIELNLVEPGDYENALRDEASRYARALEIALPTTSQEETLDRLRQGRAVGVGLWIERVNEIAESYRQWPEQDRRNARAAWIAGVDGRRFLLADDPSAPDPHGFSAMTRRKAIAALRLGE